MSMNEVVKKLSQAIDKQADKAKTTAYDTPATVRRIEGDTAWVHIPGGVDETPVKLTISAKEGDQVQVRVSGGSAFMVGNGSAPPTDNTRANEAYSVANSAMTDAARARTAADSAEASAESAQAAAAEAKATTDEINDYADSVSKTVTQVLADGETAGAAAQAAQQAADTAMVSLSTVEDVVGVLNWITAHGTMTLTSDVTVNPAHVYFVVDPAGDYVVGGTHYSIVSEPKDAELSTYYELTVDESVQNYVATHIVVDSEGLWIVPDAGGNKVLIATGSGSTYTRAGTYIIGQNNGSDVKIASFATNGYSFYNSDGSKMLMRVGFSSSSGWFTFGSRASGSVNSINSFCAGEENKAESSNASAIGYGNSVGSSGSHADGKYNVIDGLSEAAHVDGYENYIYRARGAHAEGYYNVIGDSTDTSATPSKQGAHVEGDNSKVVYGSGAHAEGRGTSAQGVGAHSEGYTTTTDGQGAHAEGCNSAASGSGAHAEGWSTTNGEYAHSQNFHTTASSDYQTALGKYNVTDISDTYACIIGNGTADNARSNALTVDWSGNVVAAGDITDGTGNVLSDKIGEDANGDISITRNITAGGDITDGSGNTLSAVAGASVTTKTAASKAVSNNTRTELTNVALGPGVWTVTCHASYPTNTTGRRWLGCILGAIADISEFAVQSPPASGGATRMEVSAIVTNSTSSTQTFRLAGYQTSGSSLTVTDINITAVRVGSPTA